MILSMKTEAPRTPGNDRAAIEARDLRLINAAAERLNGEAQDVLEYQAGIDWKDGKKA
jgi:hypothetical protein